MAVAQEPPPGGDQPAEPPAAEPPAAEPPAAEPPGEAPAEVPPGEAPAELPPTETRPRRRRPAPAAATSGPDYSNIYAVPRRPVLKRLRLELMPTYNVSINNPAVTHHGFGAEANFYLSEALFIGLEGTYYDSVTTKRYDLLGLNQRVVPSVNSYLFSGLLDFGYVPVSGKFTFFDTSIGYWEMWVSAGVGVFETQTIVRDPKYEGFTNFPVFAGLLPGFGGRVWLGHWFAIDAYLKNYIFVDTLEPNSRMTGETGAQAQERGQSSLTFDLVFGVGISVLIPPNFEYKTAR